MSRTVLNFIVDSTLLIVLAAMVWTSIVVRFLFPPASSAADWRLAGWGLDRWVDLQFGLIATFSFLVLIHVMLHWSWVCGVIGGRFLKRKDGKKKLADEGIQTIVGVGFLIVVLNVLGVGIALAAIFIERPM